MNALLNTLLPIHVAAGGLLWFSAPSLYWRGRAELPIGAVGCCLSTSYSSIALLAAGKTLGLK